MWEQERARHEEEMSVPMIPGVSGWRDGATHREKRTGEAKSPNVTRLMASRDCVPFANRAEVNGGRGSREVGRSRESVSSLFQPVQPDCSSLTSSLRSEIKE